MKAQIQQEPKVFKPRTLKLTFETAEDLDILRNLFTYDLSIPNLVYGSNAEKRKQLEKIMDMIRNTLNKI